MRTSPKSRKGKHSKTIGKNLFPTAGKVSLEQRERRNGHRGCIVWLTGLSGSGKSTLATELELALFSRGCQTLMLDGDRVRHGLCRDLGFSEKERRENIRRVGEVAKLFAESGGIAIAAFISPYRADRNAVRAGVDAGKFVEVYVNAPLEVCEARDPKGLYAKARRENISNFTGISAPYEPPINPEIEVRTDRVTIADAVRTVLDYLQNICGFKSSVRRHRKRNNPQSK